MKLKPTSVKVGYDKELDGWTFLIHYPGGKVTATYLKKSYLNDPYYSVEVLQKLCDLLIDGVEIKTSPFKTEDYLDSPEMKQAYLEEIANAQDS